MPIVTGIYEARGVVRVSVDGEKLCDVRASTFKQFPLKEGDAIDAAAYIDRLAASQARAAYEAALKSLAMSARTRAELARALARKGFVAPAVEAAIERLTEQRLIDDRAVAERMGELAADKSIGRYAFGRKLRAKGLSDEDIEAALAGLTDEQQQSAALDVAKKLMRRYEGGDARDARRKVSQALARRGYAWDVISQAMGELFDSNDDWD